MRRLGHNVGQDLLDPRWGLLLQTIDVDGSSKGENHNSVQLLRLAVQNHAGFTAGGCLAFGCCYFGIAKSWKRENNKTWVKPASRPQIKICFSDRTIKVLLCLHFHLLPNLDRITASFDKFNNPHLFLQLHGYMCTREEACRLKEPACWCNIMSQSELTTIVSENHFRLRCWLHHRRRVY